MKRMYYFKPGLYLLASIIVTSSFFSACKNNKVAAHGWTDLNHAKQLDKKKGKRLKKLQKNVFLHEDSR